MSDQLTFFNSETYPKRINFTQISTFLRCPLEFKLRFLENKETDFAPSGTDIFLGRILHKITFKYLNLPPQKRNYAFLSSELDILKSSEYLKKEDFDFLEKCLLFLDQSILRNLKIFSLELPFKYTIDKYLLTGRVDCLAANSKGITLFEFKLNNYPEFEYRKKEDQYLQLIFYTLGLKEKRIHPASGIYYFYNEGLLREINLSPRLLEDGRKRIQEILQTMSDTNLFNPQENRLCLTCGYKKLCPIFKKRRKDENT